MRKHNYKYYILFVILLFICYCLIFKQKRSVHKIYIIKYKEPKGDQVTTNSFVPINTRGETTFTLIGSLINSRLNITLGLYGKRTYCRSQTWNYYTYVNNYHQLLTPLEHNGRDCMSEIGCKELMDGESVFIANYNDDFKVKLYNRHILYNNSIC